jgi:hypothetical protein
LSWPWWPFAQPSGPSGSPLLFHKQQKAAVGATTESLAHDFGERAKLRMISAYNATDIGTIHLYLRDTRHGQAVYVLLAAKQTNFAGEPIVFACPNELIVANPNGVTAEFWNTKALDDLHLNVLTERI